MSTNSYLTNFTNVTFVLNSSTYKSYAYAESMSADQIYYFYLITDLTLQSTFTITTLSTSASKYWTDAGNYDISWYVNGSSSYSISTPSQLAGLAYLVNNGNDFNGKTIKLTSSINMSAHLWTPIGTLSASFKGIFDGGNYSDSIYTHSNTIKGLHTNNTSKDYQGLFGCAYALASAKIQNIGLIDGYIKGQNYIGGVVGNNNGTIQTCYNTNLLQYRDYNSNR